MYINVNNWTLIDQASWSPYSQTALLAISKVLMSARASTLNQYDFSGVFSTDLKDGLDFLCFSV